MGSDTESGTITEITTQSEAQLKGGGNIKAM
jgi:hypothetical protein